VPRAYDQRVMGFTPAAGLAAVLLLGVGCGL